MARSDDDNLLSARELAEQAGISPNTLYGWARRPERPLRGTPTGSGKVLYSWAQLTQFCAEHRELHAARKILARLAAETTAPTTDGRSDPEWIRATLSNLRAATAATLDAARAAARHADTAASVYRAQIDSLEAAIRGYDELLNQLTPQMTPHRDTPQE